MGSRDARHAVTLTALDIAAGVPLPGAVAARTPDGDPAVTPADALNDVVRRALRRPPCLVSFSGGIDSSVILAVAADVARREGLPAPVPITWQFSGAPRAYETGWQERVIVDVGGLGDWVRVTAIDELDMTGPIALGVLRRHGLMWPPNAFLHAPLIDRARGGSLLTGVGGDQLTVLWHPRWRALADARAGRRGACARDGARLLAAHAPRPVRRLWERSAPGDAAPWLTAPAARRVERALRGERAENQVRYDRYLVWMVCRRAVAMQRQSLERLGAAAGVSVASPLLDERFLTALGRAGGRDGFGGRTAALRHALGRVWPAVLDGRRDKATFDEVLWRAPSRELARAWDGRGTDRALVDPVALRAAWLERDPDLRAALLLQGVALARDLQKPPASGRT